MSPAPRNAPTPDAPASETPERSDADSAFAEARFDEAFKLREEYNAFVTRRKGNREQLRLLESQGLLNADEREVLNELYPERDVAKRTAEERAAELEARAKKVRETAAEKAKKNGKTTETPAETPAPDAS